MILWESGRDKAYYFFFCRWCIISTVFGCGIILHKVFFFRVTLFQTCVGRRAFFFAMIVGRTHTSLPSSTPCDFGRKARIKGPTRKHKLQTCNVFRPNICIYTYIMYVQYIYIEDRNYMHIHVLDILNIYNCVCNLSLSLSLSLSLIYIYIYIYMYIYI